MGEKIAYLGVDKTVPMEVLLHAATAAGDSLGEKAPTELYVWIQPLSSARKLRWFGLQVKLDSTLYPPSANLAQSLDGIVERFVFIRRDSVHGTEQFELFMRPLGKEHLVRTFCGVSQGERDAVEEGLARFFPDEGEAYWDAYDACEVYQLMRGGKVCAPTRVDESAMHGARNYLPHWADEDDLEEAFPDRDDAPPPDSGPMARDERPGIPNTWPLLLERTEAQMPRIEAKFEALGASGKELIEAANALAARAIAIEPKAIAPWVGKIWPHLTAVTAETRAGFTPADALGIAGIALVAKTCGADIDRDFERYAKHLVERAAEQASELHERARRRVAIMALGYGAFDSVARALGVQMELRAEPGKVFSFDIDSAIAYLATGLRAGQPESELAPAYREILAGFPYTLHLEKLEWAELVAIARAFHASSPVGTVAAQLADEVRGRDTREKVTWKELGPLLRKLDPMAELRPLVERAKSFHGPLIGELLVDVAECFAKLTTVDPELPLMRTGEFAGAMRRAMGEVPEKESLATSRAVYGTFAYLVASTACGAPTPDFTRIERVWLGDLAKTHMAEKLPADLHRSLLFASLGAGVPGLVPLLLGDPQSTARRGAPPPNDAFGIALHVASAMNEKWSLEETIPAFAAFYQWFPDAQARGEATFLDLLSMVRAHHVQMRQQPMRGFGRFVRDLVLALSPPPPPPPKPVVAPMPQASGPRPQRVVPPPSTPFARLELRDIEGLWGGCIVTVFGDGDFFYEVVDPTKFSRLHRATLQPDGMASLVDALSRHDPRAMRIPMRNGVAGEASPTISIIGNGWRHQVMKWANDKHADFDALAGFLRGTGENLAKAMPPVWTGPFDWNWSPG